ncbi:MAG: hypothetical protein U9N14_01225, partial [Pseudomonadota bacterium]|nr:hypothetical protein [Pseudomonadota bacterium]
MNMYRNRLWRAETILPADLVQVAFDLFEPLAEAMTSEEIEDGTRVRVILYIRGHIDRTDLHKRLALITESAGIELP